jgi:hypothetical protein
VKRQDDIDWLIPMIGGTHGKIRDNYTLKEVVKYAIGGGGEVGGHI